MALIDHLRSAFPDLTFEHDVPLSRFTYMKTGGPAEILVTVKEREDLIELLRYLHQNNTQHRVLGGGSNVLVPDEGLEGVTIINKYDRFAPSAVLDERQRIRVGSGHLTNLFVRKTMDLELTGAEPFLGVPGTIGGAVYNNSHYMNELFSEILTSVEVLQQGGTLKTYHPSELNFRYDYSDLQQTGEIVIEAEVELHKDEPEKIRERMLAATTKRASTQPLGVPSSGCMFKNLELPDGTMLSTGKLIDEAGLKGMRVGGAEISDVHANFIVNKGSATTEDILSLADKVEKIIYDKTGHHLEREVFIVK